MSGHSKWANIKHKKGAADAKKGRIFSKYAKEIMVAVKNGGKDPESNPRLRLALAGARASNMPRENIDRAIKKGAGELGDVVFEEITYEGYGPAGTALIIECLSDNRNRTLSDVRLVLDRSGGNMATTGAVAWVFQRKAHFVVEGENADEEKLMDVVLDAGAAGQTGKTGQLVRIQKTEIRLADLRKINLSDFRRRWSAIIRYRGIFLLCRRRMRVSETRIPSV